MRITDKNKRLHISLDTISYFEMNEFNYYSKYNIRNFVFNNKVFSSLYRRLNVQLVVTNKCPYNCPFCIEKINPSNKKIENFNPVNQLKNLKELLLILKCAGLEPTVSITGGEPTLYLNHIINVAKLLDELGINYNLNTSGFCNDMRLLEYFSRINLSVHSNNDLINSSIFGVNRGDYYNYEIYKNATIQRVIVNNDFDNLLNFINSFSQKRISLRIISRAEDEPSFDFKPLFDRINEDSRFIFLQQKIGDYYFFEEYKFGDKLLRFSFSDLEQLKYYKDNYEFDANFVRAAIVLADGSVKFDWINKVKRK